MTVVTISSEELRRLLGLVSAATRPQFITFRPGRGGVAASDDALSVFIPSSEIKGWGDLEDWSVLFDSLRSVASVLPGSIKIEVGSLMTLTSGKSRFQVPLVQAPAKTPDCCPSDPVDLPGAEIKKLLRPLANLADAKGLYNIVSLGGDKHLTVAATDGGRLVLVEFPGCVPVNINIPGRLASAIASIPGESVQIAQSDKAVVATVGGVTVTGAKRAVQFPDFRKVIPKMFENQYRVTLKGLAGALKQIGAVITADHPGVSFTFEEGQIALSTAGDMARVIISAENQLSEDDLDFFGATPEPITLDHRYLSEFIRSVEGESEFVEIKVAGAKQPVTFAVGRLLLLVAQRA